MSDELICPGNPEATIAFRAWHDEIFKPETIKGVGKVRTSQEGVRTTVQLDDPEHRFVSLSGMTSPYAGMEVYPSASGLWSALPSITAIPGVYEDNSVTGLGGNIVKIRQILGEWRFRYSRGGGKPPPPHPVTITVKICTSCPLPGVAVTILNSVPAIVYTGTTDALGQFSFAPPNGTYTATFALANYSFPGTTTITYTGSAINITKAAGPDYLLVSSSIFGSLPNIPSFSGSLTDFRGGGSVTTGSVRTKTSPACTQNTAGTLGTSTVGFTLELDCTLLQVSQQSYATRTKSGASCGIDLQATTWSSGTGFVGNAGCNPEISMLAATSLSLGSCFPVSATPTMASDITDDPLNGCLNLFEHSVPVNLGTLTFSLP